MAWQTASTWGMVFLLGGSALAQPQAQPQPPPAQHEHKRQAEAPPLVYTRATVHSVFTDSGHKRYIRLKLGPGAGLPFRTLTFRVRDPALVAPFPRHSPVEFVARRIDGENTLVALRGAPHMLRFELH